MSSRQKAPVCISVYVVKPRRSTSDLHCHHHHHHIHHQSRGGYDMKAELLKYSRQLRASARCDQESHAPKTISKPSSGNIARLRRNPSVGRNPSCSGICKRLLIPSFLLQSAERFRRKKQKTGTVKRKNDAVGNTMHAIGKSFRGFVKKLISALRRHR